MKRVISIHGIEVMASLGVPPEERESPQKLLLHLEFCALVSPLDLEDLLEKTIDYAAVTDEARRFIQQSRYQLLETLAEKTAEHLLKSFPIKWMKLSLDKFILKNVGLVKVSIKRKRKQLL